MKTFYAMLVALILSALDVFAQSQEIVISGYGVGEFAVKSEVLTQAKKAVETIKSAQPDSTTIKITVIGSADVTGPVAKNDQLSRDRAEAMKSFLNSNLNAEISVLPMGDQDNQRQVKIQFDFAPVEKQSVQVVVNSDRKYFKEIDWRWIPVMIGLLLLGILLYIIIPIRGPRKKTVEFVPTPITPNAPAEDYLDPRPVEVDVAGTIYLIENWRGKRPTEHGNNLRPAFLSVFNPNGHEFNIDRLKKRYATLIESYPERVKELIDKGKISIKQ